MALLGGAEKTAVLARHDPKTVVLVSGSYGEWMISLRDNNGVARLYSIHRVYIPLGSIYCLEPEALGLIKFIIVYFVERALSRHIVNIVLMRRIASPLAVLYPELADIEVVRLCCLGEREAYVSYESTLTEGLHIDLGCLYLIGSIILLCGCLTYCDLNVAALCGYCEGSILTYIRALCRAVEYRRTAADL